MNTPENHPGSHSAVKAGCTCPVIDNHYGKGRKGDYNEYYINDTCPLHSSKDLSNKDNNENDFIK